MADLHINKLRLARPTNQLARIVEMYCKGLALEILDRFENHDGFDGVMVGNIGSPYHFEFTEESGVRAPRCPSKEILIVLYAPKVEDWKNTFQRMKDAGFVIVQSHNPYWDRNGQTFEDLDGYRVVLSNQDWTK